VPKLLGVGIGMPSGSPSDLASMSALAFGGDVISSGVDQLGSTDVGTSEGRFPRQTNRGQSESVVFHMTIQEVG